MGIIINPGDFNLPSLAGRVIDLTVGHELPQDLFVYGVADHHDADVFIDASVTNASQIVDFLAEAGVHIAYGLPGGYQFHPCVALSKRIRQDNITLAARVCAFVLFCMHETILLHHGMEFIAENLQKSGKEI